MTAQGGGDGRHGPQAEGRWEPPEAGRDGERNLPQSLPGGCGPAGTSWGAWPPGPWGASVLF